MHNNNDGKHFSKIQELRSILKFSNHEFQTKYAFLVPRHTKSTSTRVRTIYSSDTKLSLLSYITCCPIAKEQKPIWIGALVPNSNKFLLKLID
jgi:hypothetical protein